MTRLFRQVPLTPTMIQRGWEVSFISHRKREALEAIARFREAHPTAVTVVIGHNTGSLAYNYRRIRISFRDPKDAMLFKLTWAGT